MTCQSCNCHFSTSEPQKWSKKSNYRKFPYHFFEGPYEDIACKILDNFVNLCSFYIFFRQIFFRHFCPIWPPKFYIMPLNFWKMAILAENLIENREYTTWGVYMQNFRSLWPLPLEIIKSKVTKFSYFLPNLPIFSYVKFSQNGNTMRHVLGHKIKTSWVEWQVIPFWKVEE